MMTRSTSLVLLAVLLAAGCGAFDEPLYDAFRKVERRWPVGERPAVVVQLTNATNITVIRGEPGEVVAILGLAIVSKISQAVADQKVRDSPGASFDQAGDTVRIIELPGNLVSTHLTLTVPPDSELEVQAPYAEFCVGCDDMGAEAAPIPLARLKAATERILTARVESPSVGAPVLDLEAGQLNLTIDGSPVKPTSQIEDPVVGVRYRYARP